MTTEPVTHHHFKVAKNFKKNPTSFNEVKFKSIPLFKLYSMLSISRIREKIDILSYGEMPHEYQKIINQLSPPQHIAQSNHREELIYMKYCKFNRQSFFVRAYRLRENDFFKVEVTLHSDTLGRGKHYSVEKAYRSALSFFDQIEDDSTIIIPPLGNHNNDYFYYSLLLDEVRAYNILLSQLKDSNNGIERGVLKDKFTKQINDFEINSKDIAERNLNIWKEYAPTSYDHTNLLTTDKC